MASLSLQHINKTYPNGFEAVKDFNLEIADKEFIIFVGPSGCGKSTTLRMIALAKSIAQELGSRGIRANAIAPGFILTDMTAALSDEVRAEWAKKIPLRRGGTPEDVANIATFLASDMSSYVSGQVIQVDGGMNM